MALSDNDKARVLARFRSLRGRGGVRISFVTLGPTVLAPDPDELRWATIDATSPPSTPRERARARSDDDAPAR